MRFGEKNNSIVFDIASEDKSLIEAGQLTIDDVYDKFKVNPVGYIRDIKKRGIVNLMGIVGMIGDDYDKNNGCGKSSVLEAICYANYDQIVRKNVNTDKIEKAGKSVVTRINKKIPDSVKVSYVEEFFEEKGDVYRLKRGRKFSDSKITDTPILEFECITETGKESHSGHRTGDTNKDIDSVLNMDYQIFVNSVMFGQNDSGQFINGTDKTRKEMLIGLLQLDNVIIGCLGEVRERLNTKKDAIKTIQTQKSLIEDGLANKKSVDDLRMDIEIETKRITESEQQIQNMTTELESLQKSEVLTTASQFKEAKSRVLFDIKTKEAERESQLSEWKKLYSTAKASVESNSLKIHDIDKGIEEITAQIAKKNNDIKIFDMEKCNENLKKSANAKEVRSKYETKLNQAQLQKETLIGKITLVMADKQKAKAEINSLQEQLNVSGNKDEFQCDKCKSMVSRKHLEQEILKDKEIDLAKEAEYQALKTDRDNAEKELSDFRSKLDIIVNLIAQEPTIKSFIAGHEQNRAMVQELGVIKEEKEQSRKYIFAQTEELEKQKKGYVDKAASIKDKYNDIFKVLQDGIVEIDKKASGIEAEVARIVGRINVLKRDRASLSSSVNTSSSKIGSVKKEIETIKADKDRLSVFVAKLQDEEAVLNRLLFLENVFGLEGIQTRIVKKYLPLLNAYIKEFMDVLSNNEMTVEVYINDKSKVDIDISGGSAGVYYLLSGGEKMLVRLSVSIGLSMLSFTRCNQRPEFIALDEIFSPLDESHISSVFMLLAKLQSRFNRVIVISHNPHVNKLIHNYILIEKQVGNYGYSSVKKIT